MEPQTDKNIAIRKVAVIGTRATISSRAYEVAIHALDPSIEVAAAATDPLAAHDALLAVAEHEQFAGVDAKVRKDIGERLKTLRKDEPVKSAWAAQQALRAAEAAEAKARSQRGALADVLKAYQAIVKKWPDTPAGKAAAEGVTRVQGKLAK